MNTAEFLEFSSKNPNLATLVTTTCTPLRCRLSGLSFLPIELPTIYAREAYLQNATVFEKQLVSTDATAIKHSVRQSIANDILAQGNVCGSKWRRFSIRLSLLLLSFWQLWLHISMHGTVSLFSKL